MSVFRQPEPGDPLASITPSNQDRRPRPTNEEVRNMLPSWIVAQLGTIHQAMNQACPLCGLHLENRVLVHDGAQGDGRGEWRHTVTTAGATTLVRCQSPVALYELQRDLRAFRDILLDSPAPPTELQEPSPPVPACFYDDGTKKCAGALWSCQTCGHPCCQTHGNTSVLGVNVECYDCEGRRVCKKWASLTKSERRGEDKEGNDAAG